MGTKFTTLEQLEKAISKKRDFNFVNTFGNMIVNHEFSRGFRQFSAGKNTSETYIYECLSAVGNDIGRVLEESVRNYIDNVSNIDTCTVKSMRSMLKQLGFEYDIFETVDFIPLEVQNLINIFSINQKYLKDNSYIQEDFYRDMQEQNVIVSSGNADDFYKNIPLYDFHLKTDANLKDETAIWYYNQNNLTGIQKDISTWFGYGDYGEYNFKNEYTSDKRQDFAFDLNEYENQKGLVFQKDGKITAFYRCNTNYNEYQYVSCDLNFLIEDQHLSNLPIDRSSKSNGTAMYLKMIPRLDINQTILDEQKFRDYIKSVFSQLLSCFLDMEYLDENRTKIRYTIDSSDCYFNISQDDVQWKTSSSQEIQQYKTRYNIKGFDEISIVDNIDIGEDSLSRYSGTKLQILNMEIQRRVRTLDATLSGISLEQSPLTRYSYYRKQKLLEYARFVDQKIYEKSANIYPYEINEQYQRQSTLTSDRQVIDSETKEIDTEMIEYVSDKLSEMCLYIRKLREIMKLQTRKTYMKGTQDLLRFVIQQFVRDYASMNTSINENVSLQTSIKNTEIGDIEVEEYQDETEYFNIETETSEKSRDRGTYKTNSRFFDEFFENSDGYINQVTQANYLNDEDIQRFYDTTLNLGNSLQGVSSESSEQNILKFLSTIYDIGANTTYFTDDGKVQSRLYSGTITEDLIERLNVLSTENIHLNSLLSGGDGTFNYPLSSTISEQWLSAFQYVIDYYTNQVMINVSSTYDQNISTCIQLSSNTESLSSEYENFVSGDYLFYMKKSEYEYCYDPETNVYMHDWYIGNQEYEATYIEDKISKLKTYTELSSNIRNWEVYDSMNALLTGYGDTVEGYYSIQQDLYEEIINDLTVYGYTPLSVEYLADEITEGKSFIEQQISQRLVCLRNILESLKTQTQDALGQLQNIESQTNSTLARMPGVDQGFYMVYVSEGGQYVIQTSQKGGENIIHDNVSGSHFKYSEKGNGNYNKKTISGISGTTVEEKLASAISMLPDNIYYGTNCPNNSSIKSALKSIQSDYNNIYTIVSGIIKQCNQIFKKDYSSKITSKSITTEIIQDILNCLNTEITDEFMCQDDSIVTYTEIKGKLIKIGYRYDDGQSKYNEILNETTQKDYFSGFSTGDKFIPSNILQISSYSIRKDDSAREVIMQKIQSMQDEGQELQSQFQEMTNGVLLYDGEDDDGEEQTHTYVYDGDYYIQLMNDDFRTKLENDIKTRTEVAEEKILQKRDELTLIYYTFQEYLLNDTYMSSDYGSDWETFTENILSDVINDQISKINFYEFEEYKYSVDFMKKYGGLSSCESPYYNHKNMTHPSFQSHPFLYNFDVLQSRNGGVSEYFTQIFNDAYSASNIQYTIDSRLGEFGNSVGIWKNNESDYSGYLTEYETSTHLTETGVYSEVVGYEGLFYPKALEELYSAHDTGNVEKIYRAIGENVSGQDVVEMFVSTLNQSTKYTFSILYSRFSDIASQYYATDTYLNVLTDYLSLITDDVIGFEGTIDIASMRSYMQTNIESTFYDKYYSHLDMTEYDSKMITSQMSVYWDSIKDLTDSRDCLSDQYDMFRYGRDKFQNHYALCKKYATENPTFSQKRDTVGQLWTRKNNHPIAFPALTPIDISGYSGNFSYTNVVLSSKQYPKIQGYVHETTNVIQLSGFAFYDMELSKEGSIIAVVHDKKNTKGNGYEKANVTCAYIRKNHDDYINSDFIGFDRVVGDSEYDEHTPSLFDDKDGVGKKLIGLFADNNNNIRIVLANPKTNEYRDDRIEMRYTHPYLATIDQKTTGFNIERIQFSFDSRCIEDVVSYSYYQANGQDYIDFAYTVVRNDDNYELGDYILDQEYRNSQTSKANLLSSSSGNSYLEQLDEEINSFDVFQQSICLKTLRIDGYTAYSVASEYNKYYNLNSDMSYIPVYNGESGRVYLNGTVHDSDEISDLFSLQLLGNSKNIDNEIKNASISTYQYTSYDMFKMRSTTEMLQNGVYGRIYEDEEIDEFQDRSINVLKCEYVQHNSGKTENIFDIVLSSSPYNYIEQDFTNMELIIYSEKCKGHRPYYVGKLAHVNFTSLNYDTKYEQNEVQLTPDGYSDLVELYIGGTRSRLNRGGMFDDNRLNNVNGLSASFDSITKRFTLTVEYENDQIESYIKPGYITVAFLNSRILDQFKFYHLIDACGTVRASDLRQLINDGWMYPQDIDFGTYAIKYDQTKYTEYYVRYMMSSYYLLSADGDEPSAYMNRMYLKDIELSDYDFLSDVYILSPNLSDEVLDAADKTSKLELSFKYDEDIDVFNLGQDSFYPSLNCAYPNNAGNAYIKYAMGQINTNVFDETNVFIVEMEDVSSILNNIGLVEVPIINNSPQDIRVYEDYFNVSTDIGSLDNYEIGPTKNHSRYTYDETIDFQGVAQSGSKNNSKFYRYVHYIALRNNSYTYENPLCVDNGKITNAAEEYGFYGLSSESYVNSLGYDYISSNDISAHAEDLSGMMRIYVNYKYENGQYTLYFNYDNYLNTPFESLDDEYRIIPDKIEGSYLKLNPGEDGFLDVYLQGKYIQCGQLMGYKNCRILQYHIYNVSDTKISKGMTPKPKFMIKRMYSPQEGDKNIIFSRHSDDQSLVINLCLDRIALDYGKLQTVDESTTIEFDYNITLESSYDLTSDFQTDLVYPSEMLVCTTEGYTTTQGYAELLFKPGERKKTLKFKLKTNSSDLANYINRTYSIYCEEFQYPDYDAEINSEDGYVNIIYSGPVRLKTETSTSGSKGNKLIGIKRYGDSEDNLLAVKMI